MSTLCVSLTWLSKADLSNVNSGEGGGGNVVELKTYRNGRRPYASGQSVRHALREAIERGNPGCFTSTPEAPSCDIAGDWLCDLFGYLSPRKGEGSDRRWSPLKCTPALGQRDCEVVTDLLLRMSDLEKEPDGESAARDQRLAYVQLAENIYRLGMVIDVFNVGRKLEIEGNAKTKMLTRKEFVDLIGKAERQRRVTAVIMALAQLADFAKQARNAVSFAPDILFAAVSPVYTQRGLRALELDDAGCIDLGALEAVARDLTQLGASLYLGHTPGVAQNDPQLLATAANLGVQVAPPVETLRQIVGAVQCDGS